MKYIQPITHVENIEPLMATMLGVSSNGVNGTKNESIVNIYAR